MVKFRCPQCETPVLTDAAAGGQVSCGWCQSRITVLDETPFTEADWLTGIDAYLLLQFARLHVSDRKLWLFCYACSRRILNRIEEAIDHAETDVDDADLRKKAFEAAWFVEDVRTFLNGGSLDPADQVRLRPERIASAIWGDSNREFDKAEITAQLALLRDVVGNPFRPVKLKRSLLKWNDGAVVKMAQAIDAGRTFGDVPVLADALEEAGCTEEAILSHCRGGGPHVRGCWLLDLVLGKG